MSTFAAAFGQLVIPDLNRMCQARGLFVALGLDGFSDACDEVMAEALRRGASRLPDAALEQLGDWIATTILQAESAAAPNVEATAALSNRDLWSTILERPWPTSRR